MVNSTLGRLVSAARQDQRLSLADVVGGFLTRPALVQIEHDRAVPKARTLLHLVDALRLDPRSAIRLWLEASPRASERLQAARCLRQRRDFELAHEVVATLPYAEPEANVERGFVAKAQGDYASALAHFVSARSAAQRVGNWELCGLAQWQAGVAHRYLQQICQSIACLRGSIENLRRTPLIEDVTRDLAVTLLAGGAFRSALSLYSDIVTQSKNPATLADAREGIGYALDGLGSCNEARAANEQALAFFERGSQLDRILDLRHNLGICYKHAGDWTTAASIWDEVLGLRPTGSGMVFTSVDVAEWCIVSGQRSRALGMVRAALDALDTDQLHPDWCSLILLQGAASGSGFGAAERAELQRKRLDEGQWTCQLLRAFEAASSIGQPDVARHLVTEIREIQWSPTLEHLTT